MSTLACWHSQIPSCVLISVFLIILVKKSFFWALPRNMKWLFQNLPLQVKKGCYCLIARRRELFSLVGNIRSIWRFQSSHLCWYKFPHSVYQHPSLSLSGSWLWHRYTKMYIWCPWSTAITIIKFQSAFFSTFYFTPVGDKVLLKYSHGDAKTFIVCLTLTAC